VVVDTPPVLPVTDAVALSPKVDAVVLVVRYASTNRDAVLRTIQLLKNVRAPQVTVLVNAMDVRSPEYYRYAGSYGEDRYLKEDYSEAETPATLLSRIRAAKGR
jgi:Mrp family chromosome partitioning ATPase